MTLNEGIGTFNVKKAIKAMEVPCLICNFDEKG